MCWFLVISWYVKHTTRGAFSLFRGTSNMPLYRSTTGVAFPGSVNSGKQRLLHARSSKTANGKISR